METISSMTHDRGQMAYSVLMSVYYKEKPEYLRAAMESIWNQTVPTDDFVLVCDGPLTPALDQVISGMQQEHPDALQVIRLKKNGGLGNALNEGIRYCRHELVARMDSDDISYPDRCEKQMAVFQAHPEYSVVSGIVEEFEDSVDQIKARRVPPEKQEEILRFSRKRNPFNHPCVMYRKSEVERSGGYLDAFLLEDYYLWIRMLQHECTGFNIQEPLLWMRAGSDLYKRRSGWKYANSQKQLFQYMKDTGYINTGEYLFSVFSRFASSLLPNRLREQVFQAVLRK